MPAAQRTRHQQAEVFCRRKVSRHGNTPLEGRASTWPNVRFEGRPHVKLRCWSLEALGDQRTAEGLVARVRRPAVARARNTSKGGLGRDFAHWVLTGGAHGELARRPELPGTGHTRGI